jgi:FkbM family methyltransferase
MMKKIKAWLKRFFVPAKPVPEVAIRKADLFRYLPEDAVIVEAGMYDASDTIDFAQVFPKGHIHGFECLPQHFRKASELLKPYPNVSLYPQALSDKNETLDFYVSTLSDNVYYGSGSILPPKLHTTIHPHVHFKETVQVEAVSLAWWAEANNITRVDFLWLDLQGAELKVLQGAGPLLDNVKAIFTEVSLMEMYDKAPLYQELRAFLESKGFRVEREYLAYEDMGNVLFIRA